MTTVYVPYTVTDLDGEGVELELAAEVSADGEVVGLQMVIFHYTTQSNLDGRRETTVRQKPVPDWALRQIDPSDLAEDVRRRLQARERGWP
jgi:hypothetical protein